jgi:hypothetical protein
MNMDKIIGIETFIVPEVSPEPLVEVTIMREGDAGEMEFLLSKEEALNLISQIKGVLSV